MNYTYLTNKIMDLLYSTDYFRYRTDTDLIDMANSMAESIKISHNQRFYLEFINGQLKSHISRFQIGPRDWLVNHFSHTPKYGVKVINDLRLDLAYSALDTIHAYYQPEQVWPPNPFLSVLERYLDSDDNPPYQSYGYRFPNDDFSCLRDINFELTPMVYYYHPFEMMEVDRPYQNEFFTSQDYIVGFSRDCIGRLTRRRSLPWLDADNFLNCDIYHLHKAVDFKHLESTADGNYPIIWEPISLVTGSVPQKIFNHLKISLNDLK